MKDNPKVSIVLPVYNVEEYLAQCLESIAAQTYQNYEAIIIVDGSPDRSYDIAKKFCSSHDKFKVYWQENAGSGPARNNGIAHSSGELMIFIDPDDWVEPGFLEEMVRFQQEGDYDMVTAGGKKLNNQSSGHNVLQTIYKEESIIGKEDVRSAYARLLSEHKLSAPHKKVYKTALIKDNLVEYPAYRRTQDLVFNFRYYDKIESIKVAPVCGYCYRTATDGYVKFKYDYYKTVILIYNEVKELHQKWNVSIKDGLLGSIFLDYIMSHVQRCFENNWSVDEILKEPTIQEIIDTARPPVKHLAFAQKLLKHRQYSLLKAYFRGLAAYRRNVKMLLGKDRK